MADFQSLVAAVAGECRELAGAAGRMRCHVAGPPRGAPLLLVHSIDAAASAYEVKPVFDWAVAQGRRVYAPDLPGFGFSERGARDYSIRLYTDAVHCVLDVIAGETGRAPADALAVSLGCEFLARAAVEAPERLRSLALVTPPALHAAVRACGAARGQP